MAIRKTRKNKVVKINHHSMLNIGTFMFGILFLYMIICLIMYLTSPHVTAYEVTAGPLSGNYKYTAIALKSEKIVYSTSAGSINYYARENSKVGVGNAIYSVGASLNNQSGVTSEATDDNSSVDFSAFHTIASSFSTAYSAMDYQDVYNFKADAQTAIFEIYSQNQMDSAANYSGQNLVTADTDGIVVYSVDCNEQEPKEELS